MNDHDYQRHIKRGGSQCEVYLITIYFITSSNIYLEVKDMVYSYFKTAIFFLTFFEQVVSKGVM